MGESNCKHNSGGSSSSDFKVKKKDCQNLLRFGGAKVKMKTNRVTVKSNYLRGKGGGGSADSSEDGEGLHGESICC